MIVPNSKYPAQTAVDATNYPQGKARNVTAAGDGTGTPLERDWINDLWGFQQALIAHAGITPSGTPDTAVASQLMDAVCASRWYWAGQIVSGAYTASGVAFGLSLSSQFGGFTLLGGNAIQVPAPGKYRVAFSGMVDATPTTNPLLIGVNVHTGASTTGVNAYARRYSATAAETMPLASDAVFDIPTPASMAISFVSLVSNIEFSNFVYNPVTIERVG